MLKFLRKKTKAIIWAVLVSFVAWGGFAVSTQFQAVNRSPGRIFAQEVSFQEYLQASRAVQLFSPASDAENPPNPETIEARTWEFLVLSHEAKKNKIGVSDPEVRNEISKLLSEKFPAGLDEAAYTAWVRAALRQEPRDFEAQVREHLRVRKLLESVRREMVTVSQKGDSHQTEERIRRWLLDLFARARIEVYPSR